MEETKMNEITALDLLKAYRALPREKQITYLEYLLREKGRDAAASGQPKRI